MAEQSLSAIEQRGTMPGARDLTLFRRCWFDSASERKPRAVIALVHGISEYSGRYGAIVDYFTARNYAVCAFDLRGHGQSGGQRGHIYDWSEYRSDVRMFVESVHAQFAGAPIFIYGHSLGALIVADYLLYFQKGLTGAVLSGIPIIPSGVAKPALVLLARAMSRLWPSFTIHLGVDGSRLSRDPEIVRAYDHDKMVHHRATARWGTEALAAIARVRSREKDIALPILILHGEADPVNSVEGSRELYENVSSAEKKLIVYPGGMHEPHNDIQREQVVRDVEQWINTQIENNRFMSEDGR